MSDVSQKARDQRKSKISCHVQPRKVGHVQSQDFISTNHNFSKQIVQIVQVTKRKDQRSRKRENARKKVIIVFDAKDTKGLIHVACLALSSSL